MNKFALLTLGFAGIGMFGCAVDSPAADNGDQAQEAEQAQDVKVESTDAAAAPNTIGTNHVIRLANTNLCLQPLGGQAGDVPLEAATCVFGSAAQNWKTNSVSGGTQFINNLSQKCLWAFGDVATTGTALGVLSCNISGTTSPASNSLWNPSTTSGFATLMSKIGHKNTGFCLDKQTGLQLSVCSSRSTELFEIGLE
jgi:hypothetical protein